MDIYARDVRKSLEPYYSRSEVAFLQPVGSVPRNTLLRRIRTLVDRYVSLPAALHRSATPIVHILDQTYAHLIGAAHPARVVITCHDCIPLEKPRLSVGWLLFHLLAARQMRHADRVIAMSESTKKQLVRRLGIAADRVVVASQGLDRAFFETRWHGPGSALRILHVGTNADYKRVSLVVETAARLGSRHRGVELWKVGVPLGARVGETLARRDVILRDFGFVARQELPAIFAEATVLLFPSAVEGFGRPVAEAMAIGLPVIASDIESLRETTGDNAVHVGGADPEAFATAIESLVDAPQTTYLLSDRGRIWARKYQWDAHAEMLRKVYTELASGRR
jgi:alpha-1,3-rhamnosyl/mannosyltransferase